MISLSLTIYIEGAIFFRFESTAMKESRYSIGLLFRTFSRSHNAKKFAQQKYESGFFLGWQVAEIEVCVNSKIKSQFVKLMLLDHVRTQELLMSRYLNLSKKIFFSSDRNCQLSAFCSRFEKLGFSGTV